MKLKNKLIPLLTVAATATTIAPLATSCAKSSDINMIDIMNGYTPTITRAPAQSGLTKEAILDIYVDAVKKNPEIMTQDLAWYEAQALPVRLYEMKSLLISEDPEEDEALINLYGLKVDSIDQITVTPKELKFGIENPTFKEVTIVNPTTSKEEKHMLVSMDMAYHFDYDLVANGTNIHTTQPQTLYRHYVNHLKVSYKNVPISVEYGTIGANVYAKAAKIPFQYTNLWNVKSNAWQKDHEWMLNKIEDWDYKFDRQNVTVDTLTDYENNKSTTTYDESTNGDINTVARLVAYKKTARPEDLLNNVFNFGSYYLYDLSSAGSQKIPEEFNGAAFTTDGFGHDDNCKFYIDGTEKRLFLSSLAYESTGDEMISTYKPATLIIPDESGKVVLNVYHDNNFIDDFQDHGESKNLVYLTLTFNSGDSVLFDDPTIENQLNGGEVTPASFLVGFYLSGKLEIAFGDSTISESKKQELTDRVNKYFADHINANGGSYFGPNEHLSSVFKAGTKFIFNFKNDDDENKYAKLEFTEDANILISDDTHNVPGEFDQ